MSFAIRDIQIIMALCIFFSGLVTFGIGLVILVTRTLSPEMRALESQTNQLAQKGLAEEVSGLVGNASALLNAMNDLVHTTRGIGIFLVIIGLLLMAGATIFVLQVH